MNNCRIQIGEVEGKNICTIDVLSKSKNEWYEFSFEPNEEQVAQIKKLIELTK